MSFFSRLSNKKKDETKTAKFAQPEEFFDLEYSENYTNSDNLPKNRDTVKHGKISSEMQSTFQSNDITKFYFTYDYQNGTGELYMV